ncbi:hypothetical protein KJ865_05230, partial [Myxococcota bacterium]|nr:hypothetical protein [Myxococcota bacterium]
MKNYSVKMNTRFQCTRHGFTAFLPVTLMLTVLSCANLDTYIKKGDYPRAQRYCENQKGAEGRRCFTALGEHLLDTHRYSPAVVAFQKAGRQEMVKTTYYRWAKSLRSKGDLQGALVFFQKAEDSTEIEKTHGLLGEKYRKEGKRVLAADHFRRAKDSKRSRRAMFMALKELCNKGDFSGARQFLVGWGVNNRRALIQVAFLALDMGQSKGVIAWLSGEKWKPKRITSLLARHAFMRGRLQEAEKLYPASDAQPLLWGMLLAQKWVQRGNAKRAFLALRRAKKSETDAAASVAGLLLDAKKYLPAGRYFLKAG